jgi:hypothetical protein
MRDKLIKITFVFAFFILMVIPIKASADTKQVQLTIKADVKNSSKLELNTTTISFDVGSLSPDDAPIIDSTPGQITVTCKARTGGNSSVTLTFLANGDLVSGPDSISINNINWIASGAGFINGTMDKTPLQKVGDWAGSGVRSGTLSFRLVNRWEYARGEYAAAGLFTLTAP